jgi:hypothetical protein
MRQGNSLTDQEKAAALSAFDLTATLCARLSGRSQAPSQARYRINPTQRPGELWQVQQHARVETTAQRTAPLVIPEQAVLSIEVEETRNG